MMPSFHDAMRAVRTVQLFVDGVQELAMAGFKPQHNTGGVPGSCTCGHHRRLFTRTRCAAIHRDSAGEQWPATYLIPPRFRVPPKLFSPCCAECTICGTGVRPDRFLLHTRWHSAQAIHTLQRA